LEQSEGVALPIRVVQPASIGDLVATLKWAYENKVPFSVKTGGSNWGGASAGGGTLSINTRSLPAYAMASADAVHECEGTDQDPAACQLALARGKTAFIRVGGGEVWDAVLRAVAVYNDDPANEDGNKYMVVSGSAGKWYPL
jgi:FAD/FMN-containing dehydrogenase